jgi:crotonobetaine/carnitine-CoA ligase
MSEIRSLPAQLLEIAEEEPDALVQREVTGAAETRAELREAMLRWAGAYRRCGVGEGDTVATMLPNSIMATHAWLGAGWARAIETPANTMYQGPMLSYFLNDCAARVFVVGHEFLARLAEVEADLESLETVIVAGGSGEPYPLTRLRALSVTEFLDGAEPLGSIEAPGIHEIACMIYTSGTTGPSKGVLMPWREVHEFCRGVPREAFPEPNRGYYSANPMFHVSGRSPIVLAISHRVHSIIRERFSVSNFWPDVERFQPQATFLLGAMAAMLIRQPPGDDPPENPLRTVCMGPIIPQLDEFIERFDVRVITSYGMTEIGLPLYANADEMPDYRSCGARQSGYELRVVDEEDAPLGPGQVGELIVRTDEPWMLNAGYWNKPEATAEAWRNGWFHTGDGFKYDEHGYFYFVDRIKDALRRRGENISSFEVEKLVERHSDVIEAVAIAAPSELTEDDLKVIVILAEGSQLQPSELGDYLAETMPKFMVPRYIEIVTDLPRTHTRRVKKVELRENPFTDATWDCERGGFLADLPEQFAEMRRVG